ncbi:MAG: DNA internalization-related competence protein ComEC/Rec2, partial [Tissierellia bacterium]|nr:DNA internalization-related competence protein ComEC/Rec2 [Tissierellia bacterium]
MDKSINKSMLSNFYEEEVQAICVVKENLTKDNYKEENFEKYLIYVEDIKHLENIYNINEKMILNIYNKTDIEIGNKVKIDLQIKEPKRNTNPKLFNYKLYLQTKDIFSTSTSRGNNIEILEKENLNSFEKTSINFRKNVSEVLNKSLDEKNSMLMKSIILGDSSFLDEADVLKFRKLGLSHILAISGLHIGIIFGFIIYILNVLKVHRSKSMLISIILIWIYGYLVGYPPSVLRGSIMFSFMILANITSYRYDSLNILSLSGLLMLLYRPLWLFSVGFQLSFLATATILLFTPRVKDIININNKKIKDALIIIISAQIGTLPLVIYYFNELQSISILANLMLVPLLSISLVFSFTTLIVSILSIKLSIFIGILTNAILNISNFIADILNNFTYLNITIHSPSVLEMLIYYFIIFVLLKIIDISLLEKKVQRFMFTSFIIITILDTVISSFNSYTKIEFIDVGQGDSCLVRFKDKNILIDTGGSIMNSFNIGENILLPYLQKTGVKTIDGVFISHFHEDHAQGLISLFGNINIKNIFASYKDSSNDLYRQVVEEANKYSVPIRLVTEGDNIKINKSSYIETLSPPIDVDHLDDNNKSLVFI